MALYYRVLPVLFSPATAATVLLHTTTTTTTTVYTVESVSQSTARAAAREEPLASHRPRGAKQLYGTLPHSWTLTTELTLTGLEAKSHDDPAAGGQYWPWLVG